MDKRVPRKPRWRGTPAWLETIHGSLDGKTGAACDADLEAVAGRAGGVDGRAACERLEASIQNRFKALDHFHQRLIQDAKEAL